MLDSTIELITLAASNSLVIFCFCNFIIAILLVGGAKPASEFSQDSAIPPPPTFAFRNNNKVEGTDTKCSLDEHEASSTVVTELCAGEAMVDEEETENDDGDKDKHEASSTVVTELCAREAMVDEEETENDDGDVDKQEASFTVVTELCAGEAMVDEEETENDDGDEDELRRRVEDFIDKVNKGWKAEKLRTSPFMTVCTLQ